VAGDTISSSINCDRYAVETNATVINIHYGMAPESRSPQGILDGYAALKWTLFNAQNLLGIDRNKIGMLGDGSGAWIAAGVGMLMAERDEGKLIKFNLLQSPMVCNLSLTELKGSLTVQE
jgi:acetyl esterase/lipase